MELVFGYGLWMSLFLTVHLANVCFCVIFVCVCASVHMGKRRTNITGVD